MIELPEALTISRQMTTKLAGKRIATAIQGSSPHKFAFVSGTPDEYKQMLEGRTLGETTARGPFMFARIEPDQLLVLGEGGERILYHETDKTLPKKHQLLFQFDDGSFLTVSVQGWGAMWVFDDTEVANHKYVGKPCVSPLSDGFTYDYFDGLFGVIDEGYRKSVKYFIISDPGVCGIGNGYLQDILFRAGIHPRRRVPDIAPDERQALYGAIRDTLGEAAELGGRHTERDLYNQPGRYVPLMYSKTKGQPCSECGTPIEKISYLGGSCYLCPECQT
jgi:formamidopyrimidine-DNA glycosylase